MNGAKKLKKKNIKLKVSSVLTILNAVGAKTFSRCSGNKAISVSGSNGAVTIKKGLKKGTYNVRVSIRAAGNAEYEPKTLVRTFSIQVV